MPEDFKVILPSGQRTKPYSREKITAALHSGKIPADAMVQTPSGEIGVQEFCMGRTPAQKAAPPVAAPAPPVAKPKSDGKQKMSYFLTRRGIPEAVKLAYGKMSRDEQKAFERDYKKRYKSTTTGLIAWLFLGWHYLYLGKVGMQFAFWFTGGGMLIWWLIDLFRVNGMVIQANEDMARKLLTEQRMMQ